VIRRPFPVIDPIVAATALQLLIRESRRRRNPPPPTPEQLERLRREAERDAWNQQVEARRAAKKERKQK
jgi:hypothetical protein